MRVFVESLNDQVQAVHVNLGVAMASVEGKLLNAGVDIKGWNWGPMAHPGAITWGFTRTYFYSNVDPHPNFYEIQEFKI